MHCCSSYGLPCGWPRHVLCRFLFLVQLPSAELAKLARCCNEPGPTWLRANPVVRSRESLKKSLNEFGIRYFVFRSPIPFLPYVAPHFSHISHCNLVFLGRSRACTRPSLSSSAAPPRSGEDRPTCSPGGKKAHSKYRTPALSSFLSLATFALERFSTLGACFSLSLRSSLSLSHMRRSPLERTMPTPLESSTPHCLSRRDSPSLK